MSQEITLLLRRWMAGDSNAYAELVPEVYPHLHEVAVGYLRRETDRQTLQPTALVHELYLRLLQQRKADWGDRSHFYAFAAKMMRLILVDRARARKAEKRGSGRVDLPLDAGAAWVELPNAETLDLNRALDELEAIDPRKVRLVELRFFLGCTIREAAELVSISDATAERDLKFVKSWLQSRLNQE